MSQTLLQSMKHFDGLLPTAMQSNAEPGTAWSSRCESLCARIDVDDQKLTQEPILRHLPYCPVSMVLAISSIQPDPVGFALSLGSRVVDRLSRLDRTVLAHDVFSRANTRATLAALLDSHPGGVAP